MPTHTCTHKTHMHTDAHYSHVLGHALLVAVAFRAKLVCKQRYTLAQEQCRNSVLLPAAQMQQNA
jgi:hypothetical protein